jgi:hypothetical protein
MCSSLHGCREVTPDLETGHSCLCHTTSTTTAHFHYHSIAIIARACNAPDISPTSLLSSPLIAPHPSAAYDRARITACVSLPRPRLEALCTTPTAPNNNVFPLQVQQKGLFANHKHPPTRNARHPLIRRPTEPDSHLQWCPERRETWVTAASRERKW